MNRDGVKCWMCNSPDHVWCGICDDCGDHAAGTHTPCEECQGTGVRERIVGVIPSAGPLIEEACPYCEEGYTEALTECCGASGTAYDGLADKAMDALEEYYQTGGSV